MNTVLKIKGAYRFGPRKVTRIGKRAAIYLPKYLEFLRGKTVQVTLEVLEEAEAGDSS